MKRQLVTIEQVEEALQKLPPRQLKEVLLFIEFLEYLAGSGHENDDSEEDEALWAAVAAHQVYRATHPEQATEAFDSPQAFLQATTDL
ncbi:MAG: hypothetical protein HY872_01365 [Chloroflexi bacterium]|nr:hypothetical protein [Chloroflexota bacterium]